MKNKCFLISAADTEQHGDRRVDGASIQTLATDMQQPAL
jgi:hypothetical protein